MEMIIGVDFDNTIVSYDHLFYELAFEKGLIQAGHSQSKKEVRDSIRHLPDGEEAWTRLQGIIYGPEMPRAKLIAGVEKFFVRCKEDGVKIHIISHKTEFARYDETRTNLRKAALDWMETNGFFNENQLGLQQNSVFFGGTRDEKIDIIRSLGCTHFIDDLEEVLNDEEFPPSVQKILFDPHTVTDMQSDIIVLNSWESLYDCFFNK